MSNEMRKKFERAKKNIDTAYEYFKPNYDRFNKFVQMTFVSTLTANEKQFLLSKNRPLMDFNIMEPYISRLRGEFAKSQIDIKCNGKDGKEVDPELIKFIEGYLRNIFHEMKVRGIEYDLLTYNLAGGFSGAKVYMDRKSEKSFHLEVKVEPVWDPTLMGFDMFAKSQDKNDGEFFYEAYPQNRRLFEEEYPDLDIEGISVNNNYNGLKWSYRTESNEEVVLLVDYYYKKRVRKSVVMLSDGQTMTTDDYDKFVQEWIESENIAQVPQIIAGPETRKITRICRYKMIGTQILEEEETDLKSFPYVYIDGNSALIKNPDASAVQFMTRPYVYNAVGPQKLKNFAGQSLAYGMMKMIQSPFMASAESLRGQEAEPWRNPQDANILIYNGFKGNNPEVPLQPPIQLAPTPLPPEIMGTFEGMDAAMMNSLGQFDASMSKLTEHEMSGVAYREMATLSNAAAKPYIESMIRGMQSIAVKIVELIPQAHTLAGKVPIMDSQGRRSHVDINKAGSLMMDFDPDELDVKLEAGPSFGVQQDRALQALNATAKAFPGFAEFIHAKGLPILVDNLKDIRGSDDLILLADAYEQEMQQMRAQMAQQPSPEAMKMQVAQEKVQIEANIAQQKMVNEDRIAKIKALTDIGKLKIEKESNKIEALKVLAELANAKRDSLLEKDRLEYDKIMQAIELSQGALEMSYDEMERNFQRAVKKYEVNHPQPTRNNQS